MLHTHSKLLNKLGQAHLSDIETDCAIHSLDHTGDRSGSLSWNGVFTALTDFHAAFLVIKVYWRQSPKFQLVGTPFSSTENYLKWKWPLKSNLSFIRYVSVHFIGKSMSYSPGVGDREGRRIFYVLIL